MTFHGVFTFIVGMRFRHICFSGTFPSLPYSHALLVFLSVSLSLFDSLPLFSSTRSPICLSLSCSPHLSPSLPILSLSTSFPPFLSFHLTLFNPFNNQSPSPLPPPFPPPDFNRCATSLCFLCSELTVCGYH